MAISVLLMISGLQLTGCKTEEMKMVEKENVKTVRGIKDSEKYDSDKMCGRAATAVIAAADSSKQSKKGADFVCTGVNDQIVIQKAIDALPPVGGKVLLLEGTFVVSDSILLKSKLHLQGMGAGLENSGRTTIKLADGVNKTVIKYPGILSENTYHNFKNVMITDLSIDGNKAHNKSGHGIDLSGGYKILLEHFYITNAPHNGVHMDGSIARTMIQILKNGKVDWSGGNGFHFTRANGLLLDSLTVDQCAGNGYYLGFAYLIDGNFLYAGLNGGDGFVIDTINSGRLVGLWAENNKNQGFNLHELTQVQFANLRCQKNELTTDKQEITFRATANCTMTNVEILNLVDNACGLAISSNTGLIVVGGHIDMRGKGSKAMYIDSTSYRITNLSLIADTKIDWGGAQTKVANWKRTSDGVIRDCPGYANENSGTATIASGTTSVSVLHGLDETPTLDDIQVTPTNNLGTATKFWISSPTAAQFTINVDVDPGPATAAFTWKVDSALRRKEN